MYKPPLQPRAKLTEKKFLVALNDLLTEKSFAATSIQDIAARAGLDKSAFLKRFGTKKRALLLLFEGYCEIVYDTLSQLKAELDSHASAQSICEAMSSRYEMLLIDNFSANRAMNELYLDELQVDERTKAIFLATVELMQYVQQHFRSELENGTKAGAFAATQLLLTINYNYVLKAMPALPAEPQVRHRLVAKLLVEALRL